MLQCCRAAAGRYGASSSCKYESLFPHCKIPDESFDRIGKIHLHCSQFLRIFGFAAYTVAPRQCKLNKFICIALGFCVYLQPELKERCRSGRTGQSRKLLNSLWVPGVRIPLSPQKGGNEDAAELALAAFLFPFAMPAAGGRGCATVGSKSPERGGSAVHFVPPQAAGDVRPQYLTCDHESPYEDAIC